MSRIVILLAGGLALAAAFGCGPGEPEMQDFWHLDEAHGRAVALESGRPMLVVFR